MEYQKHSINNSRNHISGWYIDKQFCKEILDICNQRKILFGQKDRGVRNYQSVHLEKLSESHKNQYHKIINDLLLLYKQEYPILKDITPLEFQTVKDTNTIVFQVQKYHPGDYYNVLHCENGGRSFSINRVLGFMTYLNTIDEAGTHFPEQNFTSKAEQGLTLIWPAYFTHPHIGLPACRDTKIIITGWFTFSKQ